ncbi:heme o synthase [Arcticibacterium luteifluviistationis]|uniref:Protoheme IX farnesyltransferase n=1 Tax=Arcticibacterium luteifluviistationis TaxID=1784714 RepID=A0A2Z4GGD3_9BACT|nr:heme o synthase [Arcticibacterium luteifluviistationis]AWW00065.1 protoheme IX farnesyltransferase [Arcticibacterium luteifluviistationis]
MEELVISRSMNSKARAFFELTKFRLSATVVFSSAIGFMLGATVINYGTLALFALAAFLTTVAANVVNQIWEKDLDKLMTRTEGRPLPTGRLSINEAAVFAGICLVVAMFLLMYFFNIKAAGISLLSFVLYGFVYTPLKRKGPIAVAVGALPGAFPPMIGWLAATNQFGLEPGILFGIQFFWQFPHFWAIAWVLDDDYKKAGFKLLPSTGGRNINSAIQIMIYTVVLLPLCWVPMYLGMTGINSAMIAMLFGVLFLIQTFHLMRKMNNKAALQLMFGSFIYLPVVQIAFLLDKI